MALGSECALHPEGQYYKLSEYCLPAGTSTNLFLITFFYVIKYTFSNHVVLQDS